MEKFICRLLPFFIASGFLFVISCEKDSSLDKQPVNGWIHSTMKKYYYWSDELPPFSKSNAKPDDYFNSLLSDKDGKNGRHYSTIEEDVKTKSGSIETTHGIKFVPYILSEGSQRVYAWVTYIVKKSSAEAAGVKHGEWISHFNGKELTVDNYNDFGNYTGEMNLTLGQLNRTTFIKTRELKVASARQVEDNPVYLDTTYLVNNKKIAYLVYNSFTSGPEDYNDHTYDKQLQGVFNKFAAQSPDEFILDLRYNPGGLLSSAQLLASMLVDQSAMDKLFCKLVYNEATGREDYEVNFKRGGASLNLKRLFILTTGGTASASELIINGLRPYMDVITVGELTEGKNVGSEEFSKKEEHSWVLHPITCHIENSEGFWEYSRGFEPDFKLSEENYSGALKELGDKEELMLSGTLHIIETGVLPAGFRSAGSSPLRPLPVQDKGFRAVIIK